MIACGDRPVLGVVRQILDEGAIDLDRVDRKLLHQRHRGIAGAEIVDGEAHAAAADDVEQFDRAADVVHHHAFGDLELQQLRRHAARGQRVVDVPQQILVRELPRREVDRHRQRRQPLPPPGHVLRAGGLQHPASDRNDQPGFLGERNELRRRQARPESGMVQRSSASTPVIWPVATSTFGW